MSQQRIEVYGATFTEADFQAARRQNALRWVVCFGVGMPLLFLLIASAGFIVGGVIAAFAMPGLYAIGTRISPEARKHGTALYNRYKEHRRLCRKGMVAPKSEVSDTEVARRAKELESGADPGMSLDELREAVQRGRQR